MLPTACTATIAYQHLLGNNLEREEGHEYLIR
jgi:hypothetical protein